MYSERGLFIDGAWRRTGEAGEKPPTGEVLGNTPMASASDNHEAIANSSSVKLGQGALP